MEKFIQLELNMSSLAIEGSLHGLQQAPIIAVVTLAKIPELVELKIIKIIDELLGLDVALLDKLNQPLIKKLPVWVTQIHRINKIPISEVYKSSSKSKTKNYESFWIILPRTHPAASSIALKWIISVINSIYYTKGENGILKKYILDLKKSLQPFAPEGLNTYQILDAAYRLDIPIRKITSSIHMLGIGENSRWFESTITDRTPHLGAKAAGNKRQAAEILRQAGLPGGYNKIVNSEEQAVAAAQLLGFPVVVKPADKEQGVGVMADLSDDAIVRSAYHAARLVSNQILVERHVHGFTHRLTVIHGHVVRVSKRIAGGVVGDGRHSIDELVSKLQHDPEYQKRAQSIGKQLISLDDEALSLIRQYGLQPSHVLAQGQYLKLRRRDNVNAGATSQMCELTKVHPDNIQLAIDAAAALKLDLAGVDLIIENIEYSWREVDALICEVNAKPQIVAPEDPLFYDVILSKIMAGKFRIPLHLVIIPANDALRHGLIQKWKAHASSNAISDTTGVRVNGIIVSSNFENGYEAALAMFARTNVREAVCLMTLADIKQMGFPSNKWTSVYVEHKELFDPNEQSIMNIALSLLAPGTQIQQLH